MKHLMTTMAAVAALAALSAPAHAMDAAAAKALAQKSACMSCHATDKKMVGPAYKAVADKYKGMKPEELAASIKKGGAGKWGPVPMPAQAALSDADAKLLAEWILAGAPDK
ncbi:MAG: c-type cytochrome [Pseudomonadota bacterium]